MNKLIIALVFVLLGAPALAQAPPQIPKLANPLPTTPRLPSGPATLQPGLYLQVTDGAIVVTNAGGSQGFAAGQFGFVPGVNQPPVIVPSNPGLHFTPPPVFNTGGSGPPASTGGKSNIVDCEVR